MSGMDLGNEDDGMCVWIELIVNVLRGRFVFTGVFKVLGLFEIGADMELSSRGLYLGFFFRFGLFGAGVKVWSNNMDELVSSKATAIAEDVQIGGSTQAADEAAASSVDGTFAPMPKMKKYKNDLYFQVQ